MLLSFVTIDLYFLVYTVQIVRNVVATYVAILWRNCLATSCVNSALSHDNLHAI